MGGRIVTVLYIDDDRDARYMLRELVGVAPAEECEVRWLEADGVEEAIARHGAAQPNAVLLDNRLGTEEGVDLVARVGRIWACPVWMLTGAASDEFRRRAEGNGAAGVIEKDALVEGPERLRALLSRLS